MSRLLFLLTESPATVPLGAVIHDNYKAKLMRHMLPHPYRKDFATPTGIILTVIGQSDNLIGGLFGDDDFLPDEG